MKFNEIVHGTKENRKKSEKSTIEHRTACTIHIGLSLLCHCPLLAYEFACVSACVSVCRCHYAYFVYLPFWGNHTPFTINQICALVHNNNFSVSNYRLLFSLSLSILRSQWYSFSFIYILLFAKLFGFEHIADFFAFAPKKKQQELHILICTFKLNQTERRIS